MKIHLISHFLFRSLLCAVKCQKKGDDLLIETNEVEAFPDQLIVPPGEKRSVKVTYSGDANISEERAYRFVTEQLPLDLDENKDNKSGVKMLLKYLAAFYVVPQNAKAQISCQYQNNLLRCENTGTKHQLLTLSKMILRKDKEEHVVAKDELKGVSGENILAKSIREFKLTLSKKLSGKFEVKLEFEK